MPSPTRVSLRSTPGYDITPRGHLPRRPAYPSHRFLAAVDDMSPEAAAAFGSTFGGDSGKTSALPTTAARVAGFLDKRVYTEGAVVKAGQVLFRMDPKPFQAQVDAAAAAMQRNQAALEVAQANLARTKPLAQQNALSQKDLDDAQGQ